VRERALPARFDDKLESNYYQPGVGTRSRSAPRRDVSAAGELGTQPRRGANKLVERTSRGAERVKEGMQRAGVATKNFAEDNPLAVAVVALAAGIGVGLALPSTEPERRLLGPSRAKFDRLMGDARDAATDVAQIAKETANDSLHSLT
jgi:hypothetical protein